MGTWGTDPWGTGVWGSSPGAPPPPKLIGVGNWGTGAWGCSTWGGAGTPSSPIIGAVDQALVDVKGGTVLGVYGDNFIDPAVIEVVDMIGLEVLGRAYYFEARLDLRPNKILAGFPALPIGTYGVKVTTAGGSTPVLPDAITYAVFAEEGKVHRTRRRYAEQWAVGERLFR